MGEGGYVVPSRKFVQSVREICDKHGILLILTKSSVATDVPEKCGQARTSTLCLIL